MAKKITLILGHCYRLYLNDGTSIIFKFKGQVPGSDDLVCVREDESEFDFRGVMYKAIEEVECAR